MFFLLRPSVSTNIIANAKSLWDGGVEWGAAVTARANAFWQDDGASPVGKPFADVAVAGRLLTTSLTSATWSLGITDPLADLAPNTASLSFVGTITADPGDPIVISTGWGAMFAGRVDTVQDTRDVNGDHWTTVTATDRIGALGNARLRKSDGYTGDLVYVAENLAADAGITVNVVDESVGTYGLETLRSFAYFSETFTGTVIEYIVAAARSSNAMMALQPDGSIAAMTREALPSYPPASVALTGTSAPVTWTVKRSVDGNVNTWTFTTPDGTDTPATRNADDVRARGESTFDVNPFLQIDTGSGAGLSFLDWWAYTPGTHTTYSGDLVVSDFSQMELLTLAPLDWVAESGDYAQVMSMAWSVAPGEPMRLSIEADDFLANL